MTRTLAATLFSIALLAPAGKAHATLKLSAEARLRLDSYDNAQLIRGIDYRQELFRGIVGADFRFNQHLRIFGEIGTGQVEGRRSTAAANLQNAASLQQLYFEARGQVGSSELTATLGRQEFADGPRQLLSVGDGSNLHRTWNGLRLSAQGKSLRLGAFDLRLTRPLRGSFDEEINHDERIQGINASLAITAEGWMKTSLDAFWFYTRKPDFRSGGLVGLDDRYTLGVRFQGSRGRLKFDWTLARQSGDFTGRDVDAWGVFAVQSIALSDKGWKPRLTSHVDIASGGGSYGVGTLRRFNQLYASSGYLGDGQFLSLSNLLLVAPGISVTPTPKTTLSFELGFARRLNEGDAAYAGGMRPYAATQNISGHDIGNLLRIGASWAPVKNVNLTFNFERLIVGDLLQRAQLPSGSYASVGATIKY